MKNKFIQIGKLLLVLLAGITIGFVLMILAYLLPEERMVKNAKSSVMELYKEQEIDVCSGKEQWSGRCVDTFTDSIILSTTICNSGENVLQKALKSQRIEYDDIDAYSNLLKYYGVNPDTGKNSEDKYEEYNPYPYARYWNGYVTILKPLLFIFDYKIIIILNYILQFLLAAGIIAMFIKQKRYAYIIPFGFVLACINIVKTAMCLQYSNIMYITLVSCLTIQCLSEKLEKNNRYIYLFLINGMAIGYFDLLTYPLVALGIPLVFSMIMSKGSYIDLIKHIMKNSISWVVGYFGMWASKWILATLFTNQNVIRNAYESIKYRMNNEMDIFNNSIPTISNKVDVSKQLIAGISYRDIIIRNLYGVFAVGIVFSFLLILFMLIYRIRFKGIKNSLKNIKYIIPFGVVAVYPFVWYLLLQNHSFSHYFYTYKILSVTFFSIFACLVKVTENNKSFEKITKIINCF